MYKFSKFLIFTLLFVCFSSGHAYEYRNLNKTQKKEIKKLDDLMKDYFNSVWGKGNKEQKEGCEKNNHRLGSASSPTYMDEGIIEILDGLYTNGYFYTAQEVDTWKIKYFNLKSSSNYRKLRTNKKDDDTDYHDGPVVSGCKRKQRWKNLYDDFGDSLRNFLKSRKIQCANKGDIATVKPCCDYDENNPYSPQAFPFVGWKKQDNESCMEPGKQCVKHGDCCSGQCMITSFGGDAKGTCAPVLSCYSPVDKDQECDPVDNPYCRSPWTTGYFNQKEYQVVCNMVNHESLGIGECKQITDTCSSDSQCCSDKCASGKCVAKFTCSVCINLGEPYVESDNIPCCPGLMPGMNKKKCEPKFPPLTLPQVKIKTKKKSILEKIWNVIIPSAHAANESCNYFTPSQRSTLQSMTEGCFTESNEDEKGVNECLKLVTIQKKQYRVENYTAATTTMNTAIANCGDNQECRDKARQEFQETCNVTPIDRLEYASTYNIPTIRSKTKSDVKTCRFNNINDAWFQASNDEKNAQLVVMAFEYLFSGGGAQDFWVEKSGGGNIFKRSKEIATILKDKRVAQLKSMQQKDILMMCHCVLAKKGMNIPEDVMSVFNTIPECEEQKSILDEIKANEEVSYAIGASGISHEAFLLNYTSMKSDTSIDEFSDYTEVNEKLESLSKYLNGESDEPIDWYAAETRQTELYTFKVKWMSTWFKIFLIVIAVAIVLTAIVLSGGTLGAGLGTALASLGSSTVGIGAAFGITCFSFTGAVALGITTVMLGTALLSAGVAALFKNRIAKPKILDVVVEAKNKEAAYDEEKEEYVWKYGKPTNWLVTHRFFRIKRSYVFPYYNDPKSGCEIYASANLCMRNVFLTATDDGLRYLTDVKKPLFVSDVAWSDDINFVGQMNANHINLINKLKATKPSGTTKRKFLKRDILSEPDIQKAMFPFNENYIPDAFDEQKAKRVVNGAQLYSRCKELNGPKATSECNVPAGRDGIKDGDIGFGYFFESQEDINDFVAYFYQHHFHWPSITASTQIGYPLLGQNIYYQTILHNVRVIMAGAYARSNKFGELYDLYKSDWDKRVKDYDCSAGTERRGDKVICAAITTGGNSYNVKYSKQFREIFKKLNFQMGDVPQIYKESNSLDSYSGGEGGLTDSEVNLLKTTTKQALANKKQREKAAYYNETVANTDRGKNIGQAFEKWNKNFSSPLTNMKLTKGGQNWGRGSTQNNVTNNIADVKDDIYGNINYNSDSYNNNVNYRQSYNTASGSSSSLSNSEVPKHGIQDSKKDDRSQEMFKDDKSGLGFFQRDENDSLFQIVSKAYQRNLNRVLIRAPKEPEIKKLEKK
jgi:hypothetical protein